MAMYTREQVLRKLAADAQQYLPDLPEGHIESLLDTPSDHGLAFPVWRSANSDDMEFYYDDIAYRQIMGKIRTQVQSSPKNLMHLIKDEIDAAKSSTTKDALRRVRTSVLSYLQSNGVNIYDLD